jgi:hypothetical protein
MKSILHHFKEGVNLFPVSFRNEFHGAIFKVFNPAFELEMLSDLEHRLSESHTLDQS